MRRRRRRRVKPFFQGYGARRALLVLLVVAFVGPVILIMGGMFGVVLSYASLTRDLPDYQQLIGAWEEQAGTDGENSKIYARGSREGTEPVLIYELDYPLKGDQRWLRLEEIPQAMVDATISIEDPLLLLRSELTFWDIGRALFSHSTGDRQDRRNIPLAQKLIQREITAVSTPGANDVGLASFRSKLTELLLAHRASRTLTSQQLLEWFLNKAYYGNLAYGPAAAARVYFDKELNEISLSEAALLAAIPQDPSVNPLDNLSHTERRQEQILERMASQGMITADAKASAQFAPLQIAPFLEERFDVIAPHFALYVRQELEARFGPQILLQGGLRVFTTLDLETQRQAECVAKAHISRLSGNVVTDLPADERASCDALEYLQPLAATEIGLDHNADNASIVVMDAETAGIQAMVGSLNYWDEQINGAHNAATGQHQPASSLYPFIYLTALSQGYTAATMVFDIESEYSVGSTTPFVPQNDDGHSRGPMHLREALGNGYHLPAVQVASWVGLEKVLRTTRNMGVLGLDLPPSEYGLALTRGGGNVTLLDLVYAYGVMNNMGVMLGQPRVDSPQRSQIRTLDPVSILRIDDQNGDTVYAVDTLERREILTPQLAYIMNDMLSDRSARCASFGCPNIMELPDNRPAAATVGTSSDLRDAWAIGYTPQQVVGVWVGNGRGESMRQLSGATGPAPIWQALMSWMMRGQPVAVWTQPPDLAEIAVCNISGLLATPHCPTVSELFIAGTQPTHYDNIYQEFAINRETNRLATILTPPDLVEHRIYTIFPGMAAEWAIQNGIEQPPLEFDTLTGVSTPSPDAQISWPLPFAHVTDEVVINGTASGKDFDYYRLAYFQGLNPADVRDVAVDIEATREDDVLGIWDVSALDGLYTLLLTVVDNDGSFSEATVPLTIDNVPPDVAIQSPLPGRTFSADIESIPIRVRTDDNLSVAEVRYYLDANDSPFATSRSSPFTANWTIRNRGCFTLKAVAADMAGNESESEEIPVCISAGSGN
jgi:membrane carboxypeptidase/penicillin-binding protein